MVASLAVCTVLYVPALVALLLHLGGRLCADERTDSTGVAAVDTSVVARLRVTMTPSVRLTRPTSRCGGVPQG
jgi:hypothetical protein